MPMHFWAGGTELPFKGIHVLVAGTDSIFCGLGSLEELRRPFWEICQTLAVGGEPGRYPGCALCCHRPLGSRGPFDAPPICECSSGKAWLSCTQFARFCSKGRIDVGNSHPNRKS